MNRGVRLLAAFATALTLAGCGLFSNKHTYRYRLTVEVVTPLGVRSGSAVREIQYTKALIKLPDSAAVTVTQRGEAVAVDLPKGRTLFALLSVNPYETLQAGFGDDSSATLDAANADKRVVELEALPGRIPDQSGYPKLVRFREISDPRTIEVIKANALEDSFGPGIKLKRITLQMTDDPVTNSILKRLPSFGPETGFDAWYSSLPFGDPRQISLDRFISEK